MKPVKQITILIVTAPPKFDVAHAGPVTGRTSEAMELVWEAVGDDHIRQVKSRLTRFVDPLCACH